MLSPGVAFLVVIGTLTVAYVVIWLGIRLMIGVIKILLWSYADPQDVKPQNDWLNEFLD